MAAESFGPPAGAKLTLVDEQAPFGPPVGAKLKLVEDVPFAPPVGAALTEIPDEPGPVVDEGPGFLASTANDLARGLLSGLPFVGTDARMKDALRLVKAGTQKEFDDETAGPYLSTQDDLRAAGKLTGDTAADDRAVRNDLLARGLHDLTAAESSRAFAEEMYPRSKAEQRKFSETEGVVDVAQLAGRKAVSVTVEGAVPLAKVLAVGAATKNPYLAAGAMGGMMGADTYEGSKLGMLREEAAKRGVADVDGWRALLADEAAMQDIEKRALIRGGVAGVVGAALPATGKLAAGGERLVAGVAPGVVRGVGAQAAGLVTGAGAQGALGAGGEAVSQFATEGTITNPEAIWEAGAVNAAQELGFHAVGGMGDGVAEAKARARAAELRAPLVSLRGADAPLAPYAPSVMSLTLKRRGVPKAEVAPAPSSVPAEGAPVVEAPVVEAPRAKFDPYYPDLESARRRVALAEKELSYVDNLKDTRGAGSLYHGTNKPITQLSEGVSGDKNHYGNGLYLSDSIGTAAHYASGESFAGLNDNGHFYKMTPRRELNVLDYDAPIKGDVRGELEKHASDELLHAMGGAKSIVDVFNRMRRDVPGYDYVKYNADSDYIQDVLERMGYDGGTHVDTHSYHDDGHRTTIVFKPHEVLDYSEFQPKLSPQAKYAYDKLSMERDNLRHWEREVAAGRAKAMGDVPPPVAAGPSVAPDVVVATEVVRPSERFAADVGAMGMPPLVEPTSPAERSGFAADAAGIDFSMPPVPVAKAKAGGDARAPAAGETPARFPENDAQLEQFAQAEADRRITALDTDMGSAEARRLKPKDAPFLSADQWKDTLGWKAVDGKTGEVDWPRVNDAALGKAVEVPELEAAAMKEIVRRELAKDFADAHAQSANGMDLATLLDAGDIKLPTKGQGGDVSSDLIDARSDKAQQGRINQWGGRGISLTDTQGMLEDHGFRHLDSADKIIQAIKDVVDGKPVLPTERPRVLALGAGKGGRGGRGADFGEAAPGTPGGRRSATEGEVYAPEKYVPPLKPTAEQVKAAEAKDTRPFGERVKAAVKDKRNDLVGFMKSKFTVRSDTPAEAWEMLEATKGKMNVVRRAVREAEADLRAAVVESRMEKGGKELTEPEVEAINLALRGDEAALATLSPAVQGRLRVMRETVDGMSDYLRENDVVPEGVKASLEGNRGVYLNRSYRHFSGENMGAAKNRNPAVIEAVKKLFYEGLPEGDAGTAAEAQAFVENLLHRNEEALGSVKVGRRNVDILTKRGDIHPAVRALWGEVTDPFTNYANTVIKMSQLIETHKLQLAIEKAGAGKFLFDRPVGKDFVQIGGAERTAFDELAKRRGEAAEVDPHAEPGDLPAMTDAERMRALGPLAKWYARPEVAEALRHLNGKPPKAQNDFVKWLARANAAGTIAQTVLSYSAQAHQVVQNAAAMAANGIFPGSKASEAFKVIKDAMGRDTPALRAKMREYEALDLLHAGTNEGLLKDIYKRAHADGDVLDRLVLEPGKKAVGKAAGVYGLQDTVFKVMTYESELGWLKKAYPEQAAAEAKLSPEEQVAPGTLKWQAAEIAKDTMATMDRAVPFVKDWRTNPVLGNFVAWPAEHMRIRANSWKRAVAEVRSENPVIKQRGAMRMAGLVASLTALLGLEEAGRINLKWSKEKAAAMRELMPEYMRGVPVYWLGESDGKVRVLSQEYLNPDAMYSKPFIGAFRQHLEGGPSRDGAAGLLGGVAEVFKPFVSEKMLNARVMDVARNKDGQSGRPVYNETDSPFEIVGKMAAHLGQPVVPGTVNPIVRNIKAQRGTVDMSGRSYNKWDELIGGVTGQRVTEIDLGQALQWRFREFGQRESAAREPLDMVERGASKGGTDATADALVKAWADTETRRFKEYAAMRRVYLAGLRVADKLATEKAMKDAGMGVREIGSIARGVFMPAAPAFRDAKGSAWANSPDGGQPGMREIMARMVRVQNASLDEAAPDFGAAK